MIYILATLVGLKMSKRLRNSDSVLPNIIDIEEAEIDELENSTENGNSNVQNRKLPLILQGKYFEVIDFRENDKVTAKCTRCNEPVKGSLNSTGNFRNHLRFHHPPLLKELLSSDETREPPAKKPKQTILSMAVPNSSHEEVFHNNNKDLTSIFVHVFILFFLFRFWEQ